MALAGTAVAERDDVLPAQDELAAAEVQHQHLVEARDRGEVESEPGGAYAALDDPALAIDQFQFHQAQQIECVSEHRNRLGGVGCDCVIR